MRSAVLILGLTSGLLACGSSADLGRTGSQGTGVLTSPTATSTAATPTVSAAATAASVTATATAPTAPPVTIEARNLGEVNTQIPTVNFSGDQQDVPAPYFGRQSPSGSAAEPAPGFSPSTTDQLFCWAVAVINARPQPRDEFQEVVVADQYFSAIQRHVPSDLQDDFELIGQFTAAIVEAGSFTDADEVPNDDGVAIALVTINDFVDERCLGLS